MDQVPDPVISSHFQSNADKLMSAENATQIHLESATETTSCFHMYSREVFASAIDMKTYNDLGEEPTSSLPSKVSDINDIIHRADEIDVGIACTHASIGMETPNFDSDASWPSKSTSSTEIANICASIDFVDMSNTVSSSNLQTPSCVQTRPDMKGLDVVSVNVKNTTEFVELIGGPADIQQHDTSNTSTSNIWKDVENISEHNIGDREAQSKKSVELLVESLSSNVSNMPIESYSPTVEMPSLINHVSSNAHHDTKQSENIKDTQRSQFAGNSSLTISSNGQDTTHIVDRFSIPRAHGQQENPKYQQMHVPFRNWKKEVIVRIHGDKTGRNPGTAIPQYTPPGRTAPLRGRAYVEEYLELNDLPASMIDAFDFPPLFCVCHREETSDVYKECSANIAGCGGWFHPRCVGWTNEEFDERVDKKLKWVCPLCTAYVYQTEAAAKKLIIKLNKRKKDDADEEFSESEESYSYRDDVKTLAKIDNKKIMWFLRDGNFLLSVGVINRPTMPARVHNVFNSQEVPHFHWIDGLEFRTFKKPHRVWGKETESERFPPKPQPKPKPRSKPKSQTLRSKSSEPSKDKMSFPSHHLLLNTAQTDKIDLESAHEILEEKIGYKSRAHSRATSEQTYRTATYHNIKSAGSRTGGGALYTREEPFVSSSSSSAIESTATPHLILPNPNNLAPSTSLRAPMGYIAPTPFPRFTPLAANVGSIGSSGFQVGTHMSGTLPHCASDTTATSSQLPFPKPGATTNVTSSWSVDPSGRIVPRPSESYLLPQRGHIATSASPDTTATMEASSNVAFDTMRPILLQQQALQQHPSLFWSVATPNTSESISAGTTHAGLTGTCHKMPQRTHLKPESIKRPEPSVCLLSAVTKPSLTSDKVNAQSFTNFAEYATKTGEYSRGSNVASIMAHTSLAGNDSCSDGVHKQASTGFVKNEKTGEHIGIFHSNKLSKDLEYFKAISERKMQSRIYPLPRESHGVSSTAHTLSLDGNDSCLKVQACNERERGQASIESPVLFDEEFYLHNISTDTNPDRIPWFVGKPPTLTEDLKGHNIRVVAAPANAAGTLKYAFVSIRGGWKEYEDFSLFSEETRRQRSSANAKAVEVRIKESLLLAAQQAFDSYVAKRKQISAKKQVTNGLAPTLAQLPLNDGGMCLSSVGPGSITDLPKQCQTRCAICLCMLKMLCEVKLEAIGGISRDEIITGRSDEDGAVEIDENSVDATMDGLNTELLISSRLRNKRPLAAGSSTAESRQSYLRKKSRMNVPQNGLELVSTRHVGIYPVIVHDKCWNKYENNALKHIIDCTISKGVIALEELCEYNQYDLLTCDLCGRFGAALFKFKVPETVFVEGIKYNEWMGHWPCVLFLAHSGMLCTEKVIKKCARVARRCSVAAITDASGGDTGIAYSQGSCVFLKRFRKFSCSVCGSREGLTVCCNNPTCGVTAHHLCASLGNWGIYCVDSSRSPMFYCPCHSLSGNP